MVSNKKVNDENRKPNETRNEESRSKHPSLDFMLSKRYSNSRSNSRNEHNISDKKRKEKSRSTINLSKNYTKRPK